MPSKLSHARGSLVEVRGQKETEEKEGKAEMQSVTAVSVQRLDSLRRVSMAVEMVVWQQRLRKSARLKQG